MAIRVLKSELKWNRKTALILFSAILVALFFVYDYHDVITKQPQSVHAWRQSDCASQALNYAERSSNFFDTQIHGLISNDYQTGHSMEEFPLLYYLVGMLYKVFGHHVFLFRLTNLLIFIVGLYYLFNLYLKTTGDKFWSLTQTLFLFTSPVIVFYANNFILNTPAFALTLVGWYYFFVYLETNRHKHLLLAVLLFTLGPLLKISELISIFTIMGIIFLDFFRIIPFKKGERLFSNPLLVSVYSVLSVAIVFAWYYYSHYYNSIHDQVYYNYTTRDFFSLSVEAKEYINKIIAEYWSKYYHNRIGLYFYGVTMLVNLVFIKKVNKLYMAISSIMLFGSILFVILFYGFLMNHDYYIISLYITTIFSTITFLDLLLRNYTYIINSKIFKIAFVVLLGYSVHYADQKMRVRYRGWENEVYLSERRDIYFIKPYLDEIGIPKDARVISIPDPTPNLTLFLMNRQGWTNLIHRDNAVLISLAIERGADYLIINDPRLLSDESIKPYLYHKFAEFRNVAIYKLDGVVDSSYYHNRKWEATLWDMETISEDEEHIISDTLSKTISSNFLTDEFSYSGSYSLKVPPGHFALNYLEDNVVEYQKYQVSLMVYANHPISSNLIICVSSPDEFYLPVKPTGKLNSSGWQQIEVQFRVPPNTKNKRLSIDFYNTDEFDIYLDDFMITKLN